MAKKTPGLYRRNGLWHIDKQIKGYGRVCESTGERDLERAERYLALRLEGIRRISVHGIRPTRTFVEAATKYLEENRGNRGIQREADGLSEVLKYVDPQTPLEQIHDGTFDSFKERTTECGTRGGDHQPRRAPVRRMLKSAGACGEMRADLGSRRWPSSGQSREKAQALPSYVGGTAQALPTAAGAPAKDGVIQGEYGLPGARGG